MDPFASHVLRALLALLWPSLVPPLAKKHHPTDRSRKSAAWAARHGPLKSIFTESTEKQSISRLKRYTTEFEHIAARLVQILKDETCGNEIRALAVNKVASPVLQVRFITLLVGFGWISL